MHPVLKDNSIQKCLNYSTLSAYAQNIDWVQVSYAVQILFVFLEEFTRCLEGIVNSDGENNVTLVNCDLGEGVRT